MPAGSVKGIIDAAIGVVPSLVGDLVDGVSARDLPQIPSHISARDIVNAQPIPKLSLFERNNPDVGPCGVPMYNFDMCADSLDGVTILSSIPGLGQAQFDNVPPACMVLSTVLSGACDQSLGPGPTSCGSACLLYTGLTDEDLNNIKQALRV
ncbi:hypothetical protein F5Y05DRAFT_415944 [Hypoxylon sp. FL0543]|nr:hypothetical protein F5Y05DRAFT_415944 [Hypoxylon sp. FL0543]